MYNGLYREHIRVDKRSPGGHAEQEMEIQKKNRSTEIYGGSLMKKTAILCLILIGVMTLTACTSAVSTAEDKTTIEMELNENYDDTDPFINEKLFCVSEDLDTLSAKGTFEMDGRTGILEVKNNKTDEVLWSNMWEGTVKSESFSISLENLKKAEEYVVCFTGTEITHATIEVAFESDFVQERETPAR